MTKVKDINLNYATEIAKQNTSYEEIAEKLDIPLQTLFYILFDFSEKEKTKEEPEENIKLRAAIFKGKYLRNQTNIKNIGV